jgi:hypothetical protein
MIMLGTLVILLPAMAANSASMLMLVSLVSRL